MERGSLGASTIYGVLPILIRAQIAGHILRLHYATPDKPCQRDAEEAQIGTHFERKRRLYSTTLLHWSHGVGPKQRAYWGGMRPKRGSVLHHKMKNVSDKAFPEDI